VALLKSNLKPTTPPDREQVAKLIRDLDARSFAVRTKAQTELARLGGIVEAELRAALTDKPSVQTKLILDELLAGTGPWVKSGDTLRELRAVSLLARMSTPEARGLLEKLAGGSKQARMTREAWTALELIKHRAPGRQ
jgi:hypothetical protein